MAKNKHFILVGRTSKAIAQGIVTEFSNGGDGDNGPLIDKKGCVIQSRFGTYGDGEASAELFVDGKLPDHPIEQKLSESDKIEIAQNLDNAYVTIVHSLSGANTSSRAMSLLFMASKLKDTYGVKRIKVIAPHLPFMRNDREFIKTAPDGTITKQFNAVSCLEYAKLLKFSGVDKVVGFEPHSRDGVRHYLKIFGENKAEFIRMGDFFAQTIRAGNPMVTNNQCAIMIGSPDGMNKEKDYGIARAVSFGKALYAGTLFEKFANASNFRKRPYMFGIHKERDGPTSTHIVNFHGDVAGKKCIIIDDIYSSGGTTLQAAQELRKHGATEIIAIATHGVLVDGALQRMLDSPLLDKVMLTDTIPGVLDKANGHGLHDHDKLVVESVSSLVNQVIARDMQRHYKMA